MNEKTKRILELRSEGKLYHEISEELNCTVKSVARVCENYGYTYKTIPKPKTKEEKPKHNKIYDEDIKRLNAEGKGNREIAEELGISLEQIRSISKRLGLRNNESVRYEQIVKRVIELRHSFVRVEDIAIKLNVSIRTVTHICSKYHVCYSDIEDAWKIHVEELRKAGYDYFECAEILNIKQEDVEHFCQRHHLAYGDLGDETRHRANNGGKNKGQTAIDWDSKVQKILGGRFKLIERIPAERGEAKLILRCSTCGTEKTISSVSLRGASNHQKIKCMTCFLEGNQKAREVKKEQERIEKEFNRLRKRQESGHQMSLNFCLDCGQIIPSRSHYCELHREIHQKESLRRLWKNNEYKRQSRMKGKIKDKDIEIHKLAKRDGDVCWLCGQLVDWNDYKIIKGQKQSGNYYPSIDHVVPVALGGEHSWDNVKLAHRICNSYKGAKPLSMPLV